MIYLLDFTYKIIQKLSSLVSDIIRILSCMIFEYKSIAFLVKMQVYSYIFTKMS